MSRSAKRLRRQGRDTPEPVHGVEPTETTEPPGDLPPPMGIGQPEIIGFVSGLHSGSGPDRMKGVATMFINLLTSTYTDQMQAANNMLHALDTNRREEVAQEMLDAFGERVLGERYKPRKSKDPAISLPSNYEDKHVLQILGGVRDGILGFGDDDKRAINRYFGKKQERKEKSAELAGLMRETLIQATESRLPASE